MAYKMYMAGILMPVTPSKVKVKVNNQNETMNLINGEEIQILKRPGLTDVSFDLLLPAASYPFANGNVQPANYYLSLFDNLKTGKKSFQWILNRSLPNGKPLFYTNLTVGLEDYQIVDDVKEGFDIVVSIKLKQWRSYGTKTVKIEDKKATVEATKRETSNAPKETAYTVKKGDCLWNIAKKYLGDGALYSKIYDLNKAQISDPNLIHPGQTLILPSLYDPSTKSSTGEVSGAGRYTTLKRDS